MKRRSFFKDVSFAVIASLVPKILQPAIPEVVEEMIKVEFTFFTVLDPYDKVQTKIFKHSSAYWLPKDTVEELMYIWQHGDVKNNL